MGSGLLGDMFDFDNNGRMDCFEQASELTFITMMEKQLLNEDLERNGIEPGRFENMKHEEREQTLKEAGLNSNEYEDYDIL